MSGGRQGGFAYLGLLIAVVLLGGTLAAAGGMWSHAAQREKERELLFVGQQYRKAIEAYYRKSPGEPKRYPQRLEELLEDRRGPVVQRHLRKPYPDPLSGAFDWGLLEAPGGGIMGVHSRSEDKPIKSAGFRQRDAAFADAARYMDWRFEYVPPPPKPPAKPAAKP